MQTKQLLKATEPDEVEGMFVGLEQTVKGGTSVIFSFPLPGRIMAVCARRQVRDLKSEAVKLETE
jgi:hypothetical protein